MTDNYEVRDVIDKETLSTVKSVGDTYKYGFSTDIETEYAPLGLNEDIVKLISKKNNEPKWMLDWRLKAFNRWKKLKQPDWALLKIPEIDFQDQYYYARPANMKEKPKSLDEVDPKLLETYSKLGIPLTEQKKLAGVIEEKPEEKSPESKKPITVRSVQRPIINLVQRTAAAQGVDVTVKQAQEIAITITKNLVNQMRANGVEFKGVSKDLKESVIGEIELELLEAKLVKQTASLMDPEKWMTLAKAAIKKFQDLGFTNKKVIRQMKDTDNDDNFVDMYDLYLDLRKIRTAGGKALKAADEESKEEFKELRKSINTRITQMQIYSEFSEPEEGRKYKKRYVQAKKKMKISGDKDRIAGEKARKEDGVDVKDMSMAKPEAGKINISQTVGRAIQKGGLGKDVAKKITPILMKKIKKIIDKNVEGDVKYLEEKINRYVRSVIKEIK